MRYWNGAFLCCLVTVIGCTSLPSQQNTLAEVNSRTVDLTINSNDIWERIRTGYAIPNLSNPLVDKWVAYYAARPEYFQRMADRSGKYLYYIV